LGDLPLAFFFYFLTGSAVSTFASSLGTSTTGAGLVESAVWASAVWLVGFGMAFTFFLAYFSFSASFLFDFSAFSFA
jgi:hypothetical protein